MSQIIIVIVTISILLISGLFSLPSYVREAEIEKIYEGVSVLKRYSELYLAESPSLDFDGINGCYFSGMSGDLLEAKPKTLLLASEWIGLESNIEDCYIASTGHIYNEDSLAFVIDTTTDDKVLIIKGIWKDIKTIDENGDLVAGSDGYPDIEQNENTGIKDKQFLEVKLKNE